MKAFHLLIAGDSLTEGTTGISYVKKLKRNIPSLKVTNLGLGGDTLMGIGNRVLEHLKEKNDYQMIILCAGHNDLLLPFLEAKRIDFRLAARTLIVKRAEPIEEPDLFKASYRSLLAAIKQQSQARIAVTTLSCIGEDLSTDLNQRRKEINIKIREMVKEDFQDIELIPLSDYVENRLKDQMVSSYLLNDFFSNFVRNARIPLTEKEADALSSKRKLHLTIDGIHLNSQGAEVFAQTMEKHLSGFILLNME